MNMKKFVAGMVVLMFVVGVLPGLIGQAEDIGALKEKKYSENREIVPVYTKMGIEYLSLARGKPGVYVDITNPVNGATVSGYVTIEIVSNDNPTITIDGTTVGSGLSYTWDTTQYADGSHIIEASAKGNKDTVTVTVDNGGGQNSQPTVIITNPSNGATVSNSVSIIVEATDPEDGSLSADIYIDGEYKTTGSSYNWDTTTCADGSHTIYAEATDSGGLSDTDEITVTVDNGGGGGDVDKYALVIGISDYEGNENDLEYCDDDAQDWKNFLQGEGYQVTILTNSQATANNIDAAIDDLLANEDGDDYVAFTYSGHGLKYRNYGSCIISHDLYAMSHKWFESKFDTADSQHIYFAFDACQIGGFSGAVENGRVGAYASNGQYSYDGDSSMKNGVFTYYQMEGWSSYTSFEDDAAYAVQEMNNWASQYIGLNVDPFYRDSFTGDMIP